MFPVLALEIWQNFTQGILNYSTNSYNILGIWFYPLFFVGILGYIYCSMKSVTVLIIGIFITLGLYASTTQIFANVPELVLLLYLVSIVGITLLLAGLFMKRMRR